MMAATSPDANHRVVLVTSLRRKLSREKEGETANGNR